MLELNAVLCILIFTGGLAIIIAAFCYFTIVIIPKAEKRNKKKYNKENKKDSLIDVSITVLKSRMEENVQVIEALMSEADTLSESIKCSELTKGPIKLQYNHSQVIFEELEKLKLEIEKTDKRALRIIEAFENKN